MVKVILGKAEPETVRHLNFSSAWIAAPPITAILILCGALRLHAQSPCTVSLILLDPLFLRVLCP